MTLNHALWFRRFGIPADVLCLEAAPLAPRPTGRLRVRMTAMPVNPSDLIPVTGAYRHRVLPPAIAGYEGIGTVVEADARHAGLIGRRVLPLRGEGTWQRFVHCDAALAVPVPDRVPDDLAVRGYINPLAAHLMLERWPVAGRRVIVTAAGSSCADLLAQWALAAGARSVMGLHRSPRRAAAIGDLGVRPLSMDAFAEIEAAARMADVVFDAVGGPLGSFILGRLRAQARFVSYGLLSGAPLEIAPSAVSPERFHLRDRLPTVEPALWQAWFLALWPRLGTVVLPGISPFPMVRWREALALFDRSGRLVKPLLTTD